MDLSNKRIGIWGLGVVGKAAICYLYKYCAQLAVMDRRPITDNECGFLAQHNASLYSEDKLESFFTCNDYVFVSPGINHEACKKYQHKLISELDLFYAAYTKSIIAVTGSVGKTTIVHLLSQILKDNQRIGTGGNIGTCMLDLIEAQKQHDAALLELSSFQLERTHSFAPDLAIWTNFYPNHLDWHGSQESYFHAKQNIINYQRSGQKALLPLNLIEQLKHLHKKDVPWYFFSAEAPTEQQRYLVKKYAHGIFYHQKGRLVFEHNKQIEYLIALDQLPSITFLENWLILCAALYLLKQSSELALLTKKSYTLPEHRLEYVASINGIDFYNDSKATTPAATLAALNKLHAHPIILLLGGISKGINRASLIEHMNNSVKNIICFGSEWKRLQRLCLTYNKPCRSFKTLDEALLFSIDSAQAGDQILLSPAGASFDQFSDYKERGTYFRKLVMEYAQCK